MPLHSQNDDLVTEPPQKKVAIEAHKTSSPHALTERLRLPIPCPLPAAFSPVVELAIAQNSVDGVKLKILRECASFLWVYALVQHRRSI